MKKHMSVCQKCNKKFEEVTIDYKYQGIILPNVKVFRCPDCKEELFTLEQYESIRNRLRNVIRPLKL